MSKLTAQRTYNTEKDPILLTLWRIKEARQEKIIKKSVYEFALFCGFWTAPVCLFYPYIPVHL